MKTILKFGFAAFALALGAISYAQMNSNHHSFNVIKVSNAKADVLTCYSATTTCTGTTSDGVSHTVTNAEK